MWKIKHIFDGDYGCEALAPGEKPRVLVTLINEEGREKTVSVTDDWLIQNNFDEGSEWPEAVSKEYKGIENIGDLYEALSHIWCADTCAPRMRADWTKANMTLGQCSVTAFLTQDIFGGEVCGILRPGGNYHCYNVVGNCSFDLTSEQFGKERLDYKDNPKQSREVHFAKEEKRLRYEYLKQELKKYCER